MKALDAYMEVFLDDGYSPEMPLDIVLENSNLPQQYSAIMEQYKMTAIKKEGEDCYIAIPMIYCENPEEKARELLLFAANIEPDKKIWSKYSSMTLELEDGTRIQYQPSECCHIVCNDDKIHGFVIMDSRKVLVIPYV